ncbi:hypothetical protein ACFL2S_06675 [Thermodesulfobacteriota bacterium]
MDKLKSVISGLTILFVLTGVLHAAELNESFLGVKWGTNISELPNFKKISGKEDVAYYENPTKIYTVFEVENPSVIYGFYKDQFFATYIQVDTFKVFERVKDHISEKFGTPKTILRMKSRQTIYRWKHQGIKIKLKLFELEGKMKLAFYYTPLSNKLNSVQLESFPTVPERVTTPDDSTKQEMRKDLKLQRALDVMGF